MIFKVRCIATKNIVLKNAFGYLKPDFTIDENQNVDIIIDDYGVRFYDTETDSYSARYAVSSISGFLKPIEFID